MSLVLLHVSLTCKLPTQIDHIDSLVTHLPAGGVFMQELIHWGAYPVSWGRGQALFPTPYFVSRGCWWTHRRSRVGVWRKWVKVVFVNVLAMVRIKKGETSVDNLEQVFASLSLLEWQCSGRLRRTDSDMLRRLKKQAHLLWIQPQRICHLCWGFILHIRCYSQCQHHSGWELLAFPKSCCITS